MFIAESLQHLVLSNKVVKIVDLNVLILYIIRSMEPSSFITPHLKPLNNRHFKL